MAEQTYQEKRAASNAALRATLAPIRGHMLVGRLLTVVSCLIAVAPYVALTHLGELLLGEGPIDAAAVKKTVVWLIIAFSTQVGIYLGALTFTHFADLKLRDILQARITERMSAAPLAWFSASATGRVRKAVQGDTVQVHQIVAHAPVEQTAAIVTPLVLIGYAFTIDWRLALLAFLTLPFYAASWIIMTRGMGEKTAEMDDKLAEISAKGVELTDGIHVVKNFGQTGKAHGRFIDACTEFARFYWDWCGPLIRTSAVAMVFIAVSTVMALNLGLGLLMAHAGWVSVPQVLTCSLIALIVPRTVEVLGNTTWAYQQAGHAALRLQEVLNTEQMTYPATSTQPQGYAVAFEGVHFSYHDDGAAPAALTDMNLTLPVGSVTALIGPSGSGKSTLATMLARFRDPDQGRITIGGVDLREIREEELYRLVGFVLQQPYLQRRSIRDNVALARPEASLDELREAARRAQILEDIEALPRGWDTVVGEDTDLSGGQKQRLSIARAIVADAPILVLDEATTATDPDCEAQIQRALAELARGRTVLVIAHHAEAVRGADQICIMDAGRVVACAAPGELRDHPYWTALQVRSAL
ncbi:MAG: ABC transporter ATP-binding protein [Bowdeniella nasicola]|nr:ABC transporter ATP-binding protein [Bowdeniella nasicola]